MRRLAEATCSAGDEKEVLSSRLESSETSGKPRMDRRVLLLAETTPDIADRPAVPDRDEWRESGREGGCDWRVLRGKSDQERAKSSSSVDEIFPKEPGVRWLDAGRWRELGLEPGLELGLEGGCCLNEYASWLASGVCMRLLAK